MVWQIKIIVILVYLGAVFFVGHIAGKNRPRSDLEFIAADGSFGLFNMYFLMGGAIFSAFAYLGGPGWAYSRGAASYYILGFCILGMLPWWIWGPRVFVAGKKYQYLTQAHLFADRFQSSTLSIIVALISLLAFIQYIGLQMKGCAYILEVASDGQIPCWEGALIIYIVVVSYVFLGGVRAVAWTNVFQGILMLAVAWSMGLYCVFSFFGGPGEMFTRIAMIKPNHLLIGTLDSMSFMDYSSSLIVSALGFTMWPHLFMKAFTAKSERVIKATVVMYPTYAAFLVPILFIGFAGVLIVDPVELGAADRILPFIFTKMNLHPVILGIILAAALSAAMSSQDAITHAAGAILTQDIIRPLAYRKLSHHQALRITRISVVGFGAVAYFVAVFCGQSLVSLLLGAYGSIVQFLPITIATFFWPRATGGGVIAGLCAGVCFNYLIVLGIVPKLWDIHAGIQGLIVNICFLIMVSILQHPMRNEHVARFMNL